MSGRLLFHPETGHSMMTEEQAVPIYLQSGWVDKADWDEQQERAAARRAAYEAKQKAQAESSAPAEQDTPEQPQARPSFRGPATSPSSGSDDKE